MTRLLLIAIAAGLALLSSSVVRAGAPAGSPLPVSLSVSPYQLQCDGDSARLTVHAYNEWGGAPAAHVPVAIVMYGGTITLRDETSTAVTTRYRHDILLTETDGQGRVQAWLTPTPGLSVGYEYEVFAGDLSDLETRIGSGYLYRPEGACPFRARPDEAISLSGRVWHDRDADGVQDVGEPGIAHMKLSLSGTFGSSEGSPTPHYDYTDGGGYFVWNDPPSMRNVPSDWDIFCVARERYRIVSVEGAPFDESDPCEGLLPYGGGWPNYHINIGVQPRDP